jgi:hypothetical protein
MVHWLLFSLQDAGYRPAIAFMNFGKVAFFAAGAYTSFMTIVQTLSSKMGKIEERGDAQKKRWRKRGQ